MCTFVLGTLPENAALKRLERDFFQFSKVAPGTVASLLQPGELFGRMTSCYCDCGTALGIGADTERAGQSKREFIERRLDRLRRKGWSRNRIERWLAQVEADEDRHANAEAEKHAKGAREWHGWLRHALEEVRVEHVGLLVDDFYGQLDDAYDDDEKPTPSVRDVHLREVDERFLENLEKGVLYRVVDRRGAEPSTCRW